MRMVSLCSAHQDASNSIHVDLKVTWPEVNHWPRPDAVIMCIFRCVSIRGSRWCCYFCSSTVSSKVIGKKKLPGPASVTFLTFLPLWRHFLPDLKMASVKIVDHVRLYPMPFTACLWLASFPRSPEGQLYAAPRRYEVGPDPRDPSVRELKETVHLPNMWFYLR